MKTCSNCHKKKKIAEFRTKLGKRIIENQMCKPCMDQGSIKPTDADKVINTVAKRLFV